MIYEAETGQTLSQAATVAIKAGCDRMLYGGVVYDVEVTFDRVGKFVADSVPQPAERIEFGGQSKP